MLISFSVENWKSYRDKVTLSMVAGESQQHQERVARIDEYNLDLLPVAAIYGGNASGKTKLYDAIKFAKEFVVNVTQPGSTIQREYFKLDKESVTRPSKFTFELVIENICYEFSFSVTEQEVIDEKLVE